MCLSTSVSLSPTSIFAIEYLLVYLYRSLLVMNSLLSACLLCLYLLSCITTLAYFSLLVIDSLYNGLVSCLLVSYVFIYLPVYLLSPTLFSLLVRTGLFFHCYSFQSRIMQVRRRPFFIAAHSSTLPPFLPVCLSSLCAADGNSGAKTSSLMSVPQLFCLPLYKWQKSHIVQVVPAGINRKLF